jgi:hypothetical protein
MIRAKNNDNFHNFWVYFKWSFPFRRNGSSVEKTMNTSPIGIPLGMQHFDRLNDRMYAV